MDVNQLQFNLSVNLEKTNTIINALAKLPFEQVAELINEIRITAVNVLKAAEEAEKKEQAEKEQAAANLSQMPSPAPIPEPDANPAPTVDEIEQHPKIADETR